MSICLFSNKIVLVDNIPAIPPSRNRLGRIVCKQMQMKMNLTYLSIYLSIETPTNVTVSRLQEENVTCWKRSSSPSRSSLAGLVLECVGHCPASSHRKAARKHTTREKKISHIERLREQTLIISWWRSRSVRHYFMASKNDHAPHTQRPMQTKISYPRLAPW